MESVSYYGWSSYGIVTMPTKNIIRCASKPIKPQ